MKLASSIVKRIKKEDDKSLVISFEREFSNSDIHMDINKFHINRKLISLIRKKKQPILYIPFPAPSFSMALRIFLLSLFAKYGLQVVMARQYPMSRTAKLMLKFSRVKLVVFSKSACDFYKQIVGDKILYIKTGVETEKFVPVTTERMKELKVKYGFDPKSPVILHVGHMKSGRNVAELMKIDPKYQVLLVISTLSKERQNQELREELLTHPNIRIMDEYIPNIQEIYQMCDVYFFPVEQLGNCIDVPLSCLEAASCNKPVITTDYGEMKELLSKNGFIHIRDFTENSINECIAQALFQFDGHIREQVLSYDWKNAVEILSKG